MSHAESKPYYKIGEVCELTGTQPYVLRFWESEFPTLAPEKNRSGQRLYRKRDVELIEKIKVLLYEKEYTIAGARKVLETERWEDEGGDEATGHGHESATRASGRAGNPATAGASDRAAQRPGAERSAELPFRPGSVQDHQLEAEVKNLRAKLAHAEAELRAILADMDRRDER